MAHITRMDYFGLYLANLAVSQKVQKRASDTKLVNIGRLDHYVVFGIKFGPVQDFQRDKRTL